MSEAIDAAYTFPMFDNRKVVLLSLESAPSESDKTAFEKYLSDPCETSVLVIDCDDEIAKAFKSKKAQAVSCSRLDDVEILSEIDELCKSRLKSKSTEMPPWNLYPERRAVWRA